MRLAFLLVGVGSDHRKRAHVVCIYDGMVGSWEFEFGFPEFLGFDVEDVVFLTFADDEYEL